MDEKKINTVSAESVNKTMDPKDLESAEAQQIIEELNALITELRAKNLNISSWYGQFDLGAQKLIFEHLNRGYGYEPLENAVDDVNFPWFLYWEIVWVVMHSNFKEGDRILDLGGCSSLFSCYLSSKGFDVTAVDLQENLVENGNFIAKSMGWNLKNYVMDISDLDFNEKFDHITSICVFEHIPIFKRVEVTAGIQDFIVKNGKFSITFDYCNPSIHAGIDTEEDVMKQFVIPSGMKLKNNDPFYDNKKKFLLNPFYSRDFSLLRRLKTVVNGHFSFRELFRYKYENDYTFGALFLENREH